MRSLIRSFQSFWLADASFVILLIIMIPLTLLIRPLVSTTEASQVDGSCSGRVSVQ